MTDTDILIISLIFNGILLFHNFLTHKRLHTISTLCGKTVVLISAIADGHALAVRDKTGAIHIKDLRNETDRSSVPTN